MDGKNPPLWSINNTEPFRPAKLLPSPNINNTKDTTNNNAEEIAINEAPVATQPPPIPLKKSVLRVDAEEWYPSNHVKRKSLPVSDHNNIPTATATTSPPAVVISKKTSVQDRLNVNRHAQDSQKPQAVKFNSTISEFTPSAQPVSVNSENFLQSTDGLRIQHLIEQLGRDAGQFDSVITLFISSLERYFEDPSILTHVIKLILTKAIEDASFRYSGARLCCHIEQQCPFFRGHLHSLCQKESRHTNNIAGLTLFIAEFYMQLHHENIYADFLFKLFNRLLDTGTEENVKSVCKALKLTGHALDLCQTNRKMMDGIIDRLKNLTYPTESSAHYLIQSVLNLRSNQMWGHGNDPVSSNSASQNENNLYSPNEVNNFQTIYSPDGTQFTNEESEFLLANSAMDEEDAEDSDSPEFDPEMDEEAVMEYVKFLSRQS